MSLCACEHVLVSVSVRVCASVSIVRACKHRLYIYVYWYTYSLIKWCRYSLCTFVLYLVCTYINVCVSIWEVWTALPIMYARLIQHRLVQFG